MCFLDHSFSIIFLFFSFSQKGCLKFREKRLFFRLNLKYSSFVYFSSRKVHFCGTGSRVARSLKTIVVRSAFEGFSLASFLSNVQVKVNTKECLF